MPELIQDTIIETIIEPEIMQNIQQESKIETLIEVQIESEPSVHCFEETNEDKQITDDAINETVLVESIEAVLEVKIEAQPSLDIFEDTAETNENRKMSGTETTEGRQMSEIETTEGRSISEVETTKSLTDAITNECKTTDNISNECKIDENEIYEDIIDNVTNKNQIIEAAPVDSIQVTSFDNDPENSQRGGKYNKHTAPTPPSSENKETVLEFNHPVDPKTIETTSGTSNQNCEAGNLLISKNPPETIEETEIPLPVTEISSENHPIKATLVLKPGIIKNVGPSTTETPKSPIFISQSPKTKRKTKSKHDNPISRLMMLPRKIFGSKDSSSESLKSLKEKEKRKSWNPDSRSLTPSSVEDFKSKSDTEDVYETVEFFEGGKKSVSAANIADKKHEDNKMILRNLSHSPKQYRKKTRKDGYSYEDSD